MNIEKINKFTKNYHNIILWSFIVFYVILFSFLSLKKYSLFAYNADDLAIFNQVFFNTINGDVFAGTVNLNIYLADHFTPIIFLLLPFYYFKQSAESLLILQSVFTALAAWPLYKNAYKVNKNHTISLLVSLMWLCNPYLHSANLFEFHLISLLPFLLFWAFYFYKKNNFKIFLLFFSLILIVREDMSLLLLGFFILSFLDKKRLKWKLFTSLLPLLYFFVVMKIISYFSEIGNTKFVIYYSWLGGNDLSSVIISWLSNPVAFLAHVFGITNIWGLFIILLPVLFLPLINKKYLVLLLIPLFQFLLTSSGINFAIYLTHYILFLLPAIFITIIYSFRDIQARRVFWGSRLFYQNKKYFFVLLFFSMFYFFFTLSPAWFLLNYEGDSLRNTHRNEFISYIEKNDSIVTQSSFLPKLSGRRYIYPMDYTYFGNSQFAHKEFNLPEVDKILIDFDDFMTILVEKYTNPLLQKDIEKMPANFRDLLATYNLTKAKNSYFLWERKGMSDNNFVLYEISERDPNLDFSKFLVAKNIEKINEIDVLKLSFQKISQEQKDYIVRFYRGDFYYDIPLDYGMYPEKEWNEGKVYSFYYFPDKSIDSFEIFSWTGENKLGYIGEIVPYLELETVIKKTNL